MPFSFPGQHHCDEQLEAWFRAQSQHQHGNAVDIAVAVDGGKPVVLYPLQSPIPRGNSARVGEDTVVDAVAGTVVVAAGIAVGIVAHTQEYMPGQTVMEYSARQNWGRTIWHPKRK